MLEIREYRESDWPEIWPILEEIVRAGDTYTFSPQSTEEEIRKAWVEAAGKDFHSVRFTRASPRHLFHQAKSAWFGRTRMQLWLRCAPNDAGTGYRLPDVRALSGTGVGHGI